MPQMTDINKSIATESAGRNETSPAGRRAARELLLLGTRAVVLSENDARLAGIVAGAVDWEYLLTLSVFQDVTPILAYVLTRGALARYIPPPYLEKLERSYRENVNRNIILSNELTKVLSLIHRQGIEVIALKGSVLADQLYVNPELRSTIDIDLLVREDDLTRVETLLLETGYTPSTVKDDIEHPFHHVFYRQGRLPIMLELHWNLDDSRITNISLPDIWARALYRELPGANVKVLSPEDNLIYLSSSLFRNNGQQLKYLCDITGLLKSSQSTLDWEYFTETAGSLGIKTQVYYSLKEAAELFQAPVPAAKISALKPGAIRRWIIEFLAGRQTIFSPIRIDKIRTETTAIAQSLMMERRQQSKAVLIKYHGYDKKAVWLRTLAWLPPVLGNALYYNMMKSLYK